jgi:hypothetical protein
MVTGEVFKTSLVLGLDEIIEHSVGSKYLNFVLSILWIKPEEI